MPRGEQLKVMELGRLLNTEDSPQLSQLWPKFRDDLTSLPIFCQNKDNIKSKPEMFWAHVLNSDKIDTPSPIKSLIQRILIIPLGKILIFFLHILVFKFQF